MIEFTDPVVCLEVIDQLGITQKGLFKDKLLVIKPKHVHPDCIGFLPIFSSEGTAQAAVPGCQTAQTAAMTVPEDHDASEKNLGNMFTNGSNP